MRGLLLLLPVILVIIILAGAGSGHAEEEVAAPQVEGLVLDEKAEVALERDAREAAKKTGGNNNQKEKKTKLEKKQKRLKKRKDGKKSKKTVKTKSNKKEGAKRKEKKIKKTVKTKSNKQGAKTKGRKTKRKRKPKGNSPEKKKEKKLTNKQKRQKNKTRTKKKKAKGSTKKNKNGRNRKKNNQRKKKKGNNKKTAPKKVKKTKRKKKGRKNQQRKTTENGRQGPPVWSDWSSCGKSGVNDSCILNAVSALNFEKNQIQTFLKQKARLLNQNKTTGKKLGKKGEFSDAAGYLLIALGGNISTPACGERESSNASRTLNTRAMSAAMETYATLINCSASIKEGCSMPDQHINQTFLDDCEIVYKKSKAFSEDCRSNKTYTDDGSLACLCWEKAAWGIVVAKEKGCTTASTKSAREVKKQKTACLRAFSVCKKAEDAAIALVHTCMAGEINTVAAKGEGRF